MNMVFADTSATGAGTTGIGADTGGCGCGAGDVASSDVPHAPQNLNCGGFGVWQLGHGRGPATADAGWAGAGMDGEPEPNAGG